MTQFLPFIILVPFLSFLLILVIGWGTKKEGLWFGISFGIINLLASGLVAISPSASTKWGGTWFCLGNSIIKWSFTWDLGAKLMAFLVLAISGLVLVFSAWYIKSSPKSNRYYGGVAFFTSAMIGLVLANDLLVMFFFWELLGFSSWLLVGYYNENETAGKNAKELFIINRVADFGLLIAICCVYAALGTTSLTDIRSLMFLVNMNHPSVHKLLVAAGCLFFFTAFGKSAQLPFSGWLVKAMEGPTPVSALMHAATMVTAGLFLLYRVRFLIPSEVLISGTIIALVTAIFASLSALKTHNFKTLLAFSTIAQLGIMVPGLLTDAGLPMLVHLYAHAFFKSGLFLLAAWLGKQLLAKGLANSKTQYDFKNLGLLEGNTVIRAVTVVLFSALAGMPVSSGFISKEVLIHSIESSGLGNWASLIILLFYANTFLTVLYSGKAIILLWGKHEKEETPLFKWDYIPVGVLVLLSICSLWWIIAGMPFGGKIFLFSWAKLEQPHFSAWSITASLVVNAAAGLVLYFWFKQRNIHQLGKTTFNYPILQKAFNAQTKFFPYSLSGFLDVYMYQPVGLFFYKLGRLVVSVEINVLTTPLDKISRLTVVGAHFLSTLDKFFVDGFVNLLSKLSLFIGKISGTYFQSFRWQIQIGWAVTVFFVIILSILLL